MGTTNHGTQEMTHEYYEEATAEEFNKRNIDMRPRGIYKGGYLTKVTDSEITLSTFTAEIGDDDEQISVKTSTSATLNATTLDSGAITSGTPFIILRWNFVEQQNNYVEVHAIDAAASALANDIIVGKCVFSGSTLTGFDYTDRTLLNISDLLLRVEVDTGLYVRVRAGRVHDSTQNIIVPEQLVGPFSVPGSPNSRIDLVYVDTDGTVKILQGTPAVSPTAPNYDSRKVLAEVRIVNGDTSIPANRITDVRTFTTVSSVSLGGAWDSGWFAASPGGVYDLNHNLGTTKIIFQIQFSQSSDGSNPAEIGWFYDHSHGDFSWAIGGQVTLITTTSCRVRAATNYVGYIVGVGSSWGGSGYVTSGYYRVLALSLA
jgi:hypothetical protein